MQSIMRLQDSIKLVTFQNPIIRSDSFFILLRTLNRAYNYTIIVQLKANNLNYFMSLTNFPGW